MIPRKAWHHWAWALLACSSAVYFLSDNEADNDLWVHLLIGRRILASRTVPRVDDWSYTAAGHTWVDHEWLAQTIYAWVFDVAGDVGLWALKLLLGLLTVWFVWLVVRRRAAAPWVQGAVMVFTVAVLARGFSMRPQIFTYLGVAWLLAWLDRGGLGNAECGLRNADCGMRNAEKQSQAICNPHSPIRNPQWRDVVVTLAVFTLWANAHGGFLVGLGILALYAGVPPWGRRRWGLLPVCSLAVCLNPYGPGLLRYLYGELSAPHPITEWQAVAPGDPAQLAFFLLLAALVLTLPFAETLRRRPWSAVLVAVISVMALRHQRHTPLVALCAAGPLAEQIEGAAAWVRRRFAFQLSPPAVGTIALLVTVLAGIQWWLLLGRLGGDGFHVVYQASEYPVGAVRFMRREGLTGNLALPLDWGGYVLWHTAPGIKVSLDGRFATVYPPEIVTANFDFFSGGGAPQTGVITDHATLVLSPHGAQTEAHQSAEWRVIYRDEVTELFGRSASSPVITDVAPTGRVRFP